MKILVDMDGVIADFEKGFLTNFTEKYPEEQFIPLNKRTEFKPRDQYTIKQKPLVESIYNAPGFYTSLPPIDGGLDALKEISDKGHNVFICTSPLSNYQNCVSEKYQWVDNNLGIDWTKKIIIIKDKTLISADLLIDDKPEITGLETPSWEHIIYDQPYNQNVNYKRRINWANYKTILDL
ncbi:MAG: 5'-3'-deoxyribonucleotidase [DPANN group archaeon]|nr:5'-3'-deoxyribonucleotidase [DPANN group archaeon]